jgi:hypothetical protein
MFVFFLFWIIIQHVSCSVLSIPNQALDIPSTSRPISNLCKRGILGCFGISNSKKEIRFPPAVYERWVESICYPEKPESKIFDLKKSLEEYKITDPEWIKKYTHEAKVDAMVVQTAIKLIVDPDPRRSLQKIQAYGSYLKKIGRPEHVKGLEEKFNYSKQVKDAFEDRLKDPFKKIRYDRDSVANYVKYLKQYLFYI